MPPEPFTNRRHGETHTYSQQLPIDFMNRIYQGRVSNVEIPDGEDEQDNPKWQPLDNWQDIFRQHHELFQDAVNYYTFAIAALGEGLPSNHPLTALRQRTADAWEHFPRKTTSPAKSLRDSIRRWLGLPTDSNFGDALKIFAASSPKQREISVVAAGCLCPQGKCGPTDW